MKRTTTRDLPALDPALPQLEQGQFPIIGSFCAGDAARLERRIGRIAGVHQVVVNPVTELVYISYDPELADAETLAATVNETER